MRLARLALGCFVGAWLAASPLIEVAPARATEGPSIAILDMERILRESTAAKSLREGMDKRRSVYQSELQEREQQLRTADEALARQRAILSAESFASKRMELQEQAAKLQQAFIERQKELEQGFGQGMAEVRQALIEVAKEMSTEKGIDLILLKATVVIAIRELDITDEVLERLNEKLPKIEGAAAQN